MGLFSDRFTVTPSLGLGFADSGVRDFRLGWRLVPADQGDSGFGATLDARRSEPANDNGAGTAIEHGVMLRAGIRW